MTDNRSTVGRDAAVAPLLLAHYDANRRELPWRHAPGSNAVDPYAVWLSEIMLQQTTVAAVRAYFDRFTRTWPTVRDLAEADQADVMAAWAGLGYYARARNLIACARAVVAEHGGVFPDTEEGLRKLPGIGPYTAAAVAAIAFGHRAVVVDANVERVVSRLFAITTPLPASRPEIREATDRITPQLRAGDFAQAMMDLGSSLCSVRSPSCLACPLRPVCAASLEGDPSVYPIKAPKAAKPMRTGTAWWIERGPDVWLVRRPDKGMLGGMRALPGGEWAPDGTREVPFPGDWKWSSVPVRHVFTHFGLDLDIACIRIEDPDALADRSGPTQDASGEWWPKDEISKAGLPTLYTKAARTARGIIDGHQD